MNGRREHGLTKFIRPTVPVECKLVVQPQGHGTSCASMSKVHRVHSLAHVVAQALALDAISLVQRVQSGGRARCTWSIIGQLASLQASARPPAHHRHVERARSDDLGRASSSPASARQSGLSRARPTAGACRCHRHNTFICQVLDEPGHPPRAAGRDGSKLLCRAITRPLRRPSAASTVDP